MIKPRPPIKVKKTQTKYSEKVIPKMYAYIDQCIENKDIPFLEDFALTLGISDRTMFNWSKEHDAFSEPYQLLKTVQKLELKRQSMAGTIIPVIGRLLLSAEHDVVEREKKEVSGVDGGAIQMEQIFSPEQEDKIRAGFLKVMEEATKRK